MLALIRREFFAKTPAKLFFQERGLLLQAVSYPATYLNDRGVACQASRYRAILMTVINTIKRHGNRAKIARFSAYFLHAIQTHMQHHGDEYYQAAKEPRAIASELDKTLGRIRRSGGADQTVPALAELHRSLKAGRRPGAIQKVKKTAASEQDLFTTPAPRLQ